jgi:hypothetical protein
MPKKRPARLTPGREVERKRLSSFGDLHRDQERPNTMRRRSFITLAAGTLAASVSRPTQATPSTNRDELILPRDSEVRTGGFAND